MKWDKKKKKKKLQDFRKRIFKSSVLLLWYLEIQNLKNQLIIKCY